VRRFWKRDSTLVELERELRARRSDAPSGFVRTLAQRAGREARWFRPKARLGIAAGLAVVALVAAASAGGFNAASSGADRVVGVLSDLTSSSSNQETVAVTPAASQYPKPGKGCGDKNHEHERNFQCKMSISSVSQKEGNGPGLTSFNFTVSLDKTPIDTVTGVWTTADGTATTGSDYVAGTGTVTFLPGIQTQTVSISVVGDTVKEKNEAFYVILTSVSANAYIGNGTGQGTIQNDD
jgi:hypothetical protein